MRLLRVRKILTCYGRKIVISYGGLDSKGYACIYIAYSVAMAVAMAMAMAMAMSVAIMCRT
jgi:hypothetical protein